MHLDEPPTLTDLINQATAKGGTITFDPPHSGQPLLHPEATQDRITGIHLQHTHQGAPVWICEFCHLLTVGDTPMCVACQTGGNLHPLPQQTPFTCRSWDPTHGGGYVGGCLIAGGEGCACSPNRAVITKPPIRGSYAPTRDDRYRIYTVDHIPFDALPDYRHGGPATVALDGWAVSYPRISPWLTSAAQLAADDGKITLKIRRHTPVTGELVPHVLNDTRYDTYVEASAAAYEVRAIGWMVYEREAHRWNL